jgi:GNAT superfamily N-acetyltransferase
MPKMVETKAHDIRSYRKAVRLLDGREATIRPIFSEDRRSVQEFYRRLSDESKFLRYHYTKGELTEGDLHNFCDVDYRDNMGLVMEIGCNGHRDIIGLGRYCRLPLSNKAEVAFEVQDSEQRKGVGTLLLKHLAGLASQEGIGEFFGEVLRSNSKMLSIFRKSDPRMKQEIDDPTTCNVTFSVSETLRNCP